MIQSELRSCQRARRPHSCRSGLPRLARRLVEAGVRFVTVAKGWLNYDTHGRQFQHHEEGAAAPNSITAWRRLLQTVCTIAVMLDTTLVITPWVNSAARSKINDEAGRDHHNKAWSIAPAGAGILG